jgi:alpha-1,3-glucan synthase
VSDHDSRRRTLADVAVSVLWYWGYTLNGTDPAKYEPPRLILYIVWPLAAMSMAFSYLLFAGLPEYYRQVSRLVDRIVFGADGQIPPYVPNFFKTLIRRKLVVWFLISEILRSYWLSGPYGRNWQFLWSAVGVPSWAVVIMIGIFFIGIWGLLMGILISECPTPSARDLS